MADSPLETLATYLSGEFDNQAQAAAEPAWYVHLRLWQRAVPSLCDRNTYTLFIEQANGVTQQPPYRQRILKIFSAPISASTPLQKGESGQLTGQLTGQLMGQYFALVNPLKFRGAGADPYLLASMSSSDLISLPNSGAKIAYKPVESTAGYWFQAALKDGQYCSFEYAGQRRYVYLGFDIGPKQPFACGDESTIEMLTYDKGIDPDTGRGLWGALMGPFQMLKQVSYEI